MTDSAHPDNVPAGTEHVVREMTAAQLQQAGIQADYWPGGPTYYRDGQELDPHERVFLPAATITHRKEN